jgi:hypothetical protein
MKTWASGLIIALTVLLCVNQASAYLYSGNKWNDATLPLVYYINQNGSPDCNGEFTAVQNAAQSWNDVCGSYFVFNYGGTTANQCVAWNGINEISWYETGWNDANIIANSTMFLNTSTNEVTEYDCGFNGVHYTWSTTGEAGKMDVQSIALHEFGHALYLLDVYNPSSANANKVMYGWGSSGSLKTNLGQDDMDGITYLYPENPDERVWIKDAADDFGCVPYAGDPWASTDIRVVPDPPVLGETCYIYVTARNIMPTSQSVTIQAEVHNPDVNLNAGSPYLWANNYINQIIPAAGDTLTEGKREFCFPWFVYANAYDQGHYCIVATVEAYQDWVKNPWPPADNNVACHNVHPVPKLTKGGASYFSFNAGNPTGEAVNMILHLDKSKLPRGWTANLADIPTETPIPLGKNDTLKKITLILVPNAGAADGEYGPLSISSELLREGTGEQIGGGGITPRGVVGEPHDVGTLGLILPTAELDTGTLVVPKARIKNFGSYAENFPAACFIGTVYADTQNVSLSAGEEKQVSFDGWTANVGGGHTVLVRTLLPMDAYPENDAQSGGIGVKGPRGRDTTRTILEPDREIKSFTLASCKPNPFANTIAISYALPYEVMVSLNIYDVTGKLVKTLVAKREPAGDYQLVWDGTSNAGVKTNSGVYLIRFETPTCPTIQKLVLIK